MFALSNKNSGFFAKDYLNTFKNYKMKNLNTQTEVNNKPVINSNNEVKNAASKNHFEKNIFSSADLWNIQRTSRTAFARRRSLMF